MSKTKLRAATVGSSPDQVEAAFYNALQRGDLEAMMACWADQADVVCVHPGGTRLIGAAAVRSVFEQMFSQAAIQAFPERVHRIEAPASAVHNLLERIEVMTSEGVRHAHLMVSNVYQKTAQGWRMVAHHASPASAQAAEEDADAAPQTLH